MSIIHRNNAEKRNFPNSTTHLAVAKWTESHLIYPQASIHHQNKPKIKCCHIFLVDSVSTRPKEAFLIGYFKILTENILAQKNPKGVSPCVRMASKNFLFGFGWKWLWSCWLVKERYILIIRKDFLFFFSKFLIENILAKKKQ